MIPKKYNVSITPGTYQGQRLQNGCAIDWKRMALECQGSTLDSISNNREGLANQREATHRKDLSRLQSLEDEFHNKLSRFTRLQQSLIDGARSFVDTTDSHNPYLNRNIQLEDGPLGYVTRGGTFKPFANSEDARATMGRGGCPSGIDRVSVEPGNYTQKGNVIPLDSPLMVGEQMKSGQPCSYFGQNVQVGIPESRESDFLGIYEFNPATSSLKVQKDLNDSNGSIYEACENRANDLGSSGFGLGYLLGPEHGLKCAVGPASSERPKPGEGLQDKLALSLDFNNDITEFGLKKDAGVFTIYNERGPMWSPVTRKNCGALPSGSMITDVNATYGANCNSESN
jgi:hypothetical protein